MCCKILLHLSLQVVCGNLPHSGVIPDKKARWTPPDSRSNVTYGCHREVVSGVVDLLQWLFAVLGWLRPAVCFFILQDRPWQLTFRYCRSRNYHCHYLRQAPAASQAYVLSVLWVNFQKIFGTDLSWYRKRSIRFWDGPKLARSFYHVMPS